MWDFTAIMFYAVHEKDVKSCEIVVINVGLMHGAEYVN